MFDYHTRSVLSVDMYKVFDSLEWQFIFKLSLFKFYMASVITSLIAVKNYLQYAKCGSINNNHVPFLKFKRYSSGRSFAIINYRNIMYAMFRKY